MSVKSFPAYFVRGGTSNGLVINRQHLPDNQAEWHPILSDAMGSPDPYGRQLNGMGSGISSTSKICVIERSSRPDIDVDFTFIQVGVKDGSLDMAGNCGNMSSIVGPVALAEGLAQRVADSELGNSSKRQTKIRIFNTNTSKVIHSTFEVNQDGLYEPFGDYVMDGVPGKSSRITLSFLNPGGAKTGKALPTGNAMDTLELPGGETIEASLVDVANPGVFVRASDMGIPGDISPAELENNTDTMARMELIRQEGARRMGLDPKIQSVPKLVMVSTPTEAAVAEGTNIVCRALSMQQAHKAVPLTLALNLGTACKLEGTIPASLAVIGKGQDSVTLAHASGKVEVGSVVENGQIQSALLHRTARIMMKGDVFYTAEREMKV